MKLLNFVGACAIRAFSIRYMKQTYSLILALSLILIAGVHKAQAQEFQTYESFEDFEHLLHIDNDTTYVVNFWATWCGPCVKELPYFEEMTEKYEGKPLKVVLVSLDFKRQIEKKFIPFLQKNKIKSDVVLLLDGNEGTWIDKVDPSWSGSIPITIVYRGKKRAFIEDSFHSYTELEDFIKTVYQ